MPSVKSAKYVIFKASGQQCAKIFRQQAISWPIYCEFFEQYLLIEKKELIEAHEMALAAAQGVFAGKKKLPAEKKLLGKLDEKSGKICIPLPDDEQLFIGVLQDTSESYQALRDLGTQLFELQYEPAKAIAQIVAKIKKS